MIPEVKTDKMVEKYHLHIKEKKADEKQTEKHNEVLVSLKQEEIDRMTKADVMRTMNKSYTEKEYGTTYKKVYTDETWKALHKKYKEKVKTRKHKLGFEIRPNAMAPHRPIFLKNGRVFLQNHDAWISMEKKGDSIDATEEEIEAILKIYNHDYNIGKYRVIP